MADTNIYCIDSHVLIWGVKKEANADQSHMIPRAEYFLQQCEESHAVLMVPAIVVAEVLIGIPEPEKEQVLSTMNQRFRIYPFDTRASVQFARLWDEKWAESKKEELSDTVTRAHLKADFMILSIALANNATRMYTGDGPLTRLSKGFLDTRELPQPPRITEPAQRVLPLDLE